MRKVKVRKHSKSIPRSRFDNQGQIHQEATIQFPIKKVTKNNPPEIISRHNVRHFSKQKQTERSILSKVFIFPLNQLDPDQQIIQVRFQIVDQSIETHRLSIPLSFLSRSLSLSLFLFFVFYSSLSPRQFQKI